MRQAIRTALLLGMTLVLLFSPLAVAQGQPNRQPPPDSPQELPQAVQDLFRDGMDVNEFLARHRGPVPNVLKEYAATTVAVIVEMEQPSLVEQLTSQQQTLEQSSLLAQQTFIANQLANQAAVVSEVQGRGGTVIGQFTKAYNGLLVHVPVSEVDALRGMPGVRRVVEAQTFYPSLAHSVPVIKADQVWNQATPYTGEGITIAVIDTGIDYTHATFGGPGEQEDYDSNNPAVIEDGTFPTAKVIGGYDFAGTAYNGQNTPTPDPDPLDENGHGTHVASIAAGIGVPNSLLGKGVAPDASLYALKVFGATGGTNLALLAIEWSMDPNGDGDVSDRVDVVNMSLGSDFGPNDTQSPENMAVNNLVKMGTVVVAASGNAGDESYITGSPASADSVISVASTTTGWLTSKYLEIDGVTAQIPYLEASYAGGSGGVDQDVTGALVHAASLPGATNDQLCTTQGIDGSGAAGKILVAQRGGCFFIDKINNAGTLGATAIIIYNNTEGGDDLVNIGSTTDTAPIPAATVGHSQGVLLTQNQGKNVTLWADKLATLQYGKVDEMSDFTSRGPRGFDSDLKPDVSAPGSNIFAAEMGSGNGGISESGTSMASPHVAGVAALMRQAHPGWSAEEIKAAIMNRSVNTGAPIPLQGAGRVDALASVNTNTIAIGDNNLVSLNWGVVLLEANTFNSTKNLMVRNLGAASKTYNVTAAFSNPEAVGATVTVPATMTVAANSTDSLPVAIRLDVTALKQTFGALEEYYGYVTLTNTADAAEVLRVPFYLVPRPSTRLTDLGSQTKVVLNPTSPLDLVQLNLQQNGPTPSAISVLPVYLADPNETEQLDSGDLRYIGMDFVPAIGENQNVIRVGFNTWEGMHVPQPYFAEIDFYTDVTPGGSTFDPEFAYFNYNLGWFGGLDDTNEWAIMKVDLGTDEISLGSPLPIYADFNSGYMEWYLLAADMGFGTGETAFEFAAVALDYLFTSAVPGAHVDETGIASFDYAQPPFSWSISKAAPRNEALTITGMVANAGAFEAHAPVGVMAIDLFGKPGVGQAYFWPIAVLPEDEALYSGIQFLPMMSR